MVIVWQCFEHLLMNLFWTKNYDLDIMLVSIMIQNIEQSSFYIKYDQKLMNHNAFVSMILLSEIYSRNTKIVKM